MSDTSGQTSVLIVDDEPGLLASLRTLLKPLGYHSLTARNLTEARNILTNETVDAVVVDAFLGPENGLELLGVLNAEHPNIPAIVITGLPSLEIVTEALRQRAFDILTKPVSRDTLHQTLRSALEGRAARRDGERYRAHLERLVQERTQRLADLDKRYHILTRNLREGVLVFDRRFRFSHVSEALRSILGYTVEEAQSLTVRELLTDDAFDLLLDRLPREFASAEFGLPEMPTQDISLCLDMVTKGGEILPVTCRGAVSFSHEGRRASVLLLLSPPSGQGPATAQRQTAWSDSLPPANVILRVNSRGEVTCLSASLESAASGQAEGGRDLDSLPLPEAIRSHIRQGLNALFESARPHQEELVIPSGEGPRIFELRFLPEETAEHQPRWALVIGQDVTEGRTNAQLLRKAGEENRKLARIITRSTTIALIRRNAPGLPVMYVSDNIRDLGHNPRDLTEGGVPFDQLIHPEDRQQVVDTVTANLTLGNDHFQQQYRILSGGKAIAWVQDRTWTRKDADGDVVELESLIEDITQTRSIQQKLQEREEKYLLVTRNINDLIWTMSLDLRFTFISPNVKRILGYEVWEMYRSPLSVLFTPSVLEEIAEAISRELRADGQPGVDPTRSVTLELPHTRANGETRWLEVQVSFIRDPGGEPVALAGVSRDIQERKIAELERQRLQEQLLHAQKLETLGLLAGGVAHDFNNLLTGVIGNIGLLELDTPDGDPARELLGDVRLAGERAAKLSKQLLAFSRRESIEPHPVDLNRLVRDLNSMLSRIIGERIRFLTRLSPRLGNVMADMSQMEQVLLNLVVNARDAMPGGGTLNIETEATEVTDPVPIGSRELQPGSYIRLTVRDTGHGMDSSTAERVFEPFFTTKPKHKGTGLGLSTVHNIVTRHQGAISVESSPGAGAAFHIYLPRVEQEPGGALAADHPLHGAQVDGDEHVFVVEDDPVVRKLATRALSRLGYRVTAAENGAEALAMLHEREHPPDLLITDLVMPRMNGVELAMRVAVQHEGLPVLFTSGYTDGLIEGVELGTLTHAFLAKPFSPLQLAVKVRAMLDGNT